MQGVEVPIEKIEDALRKSSGNISKAARALKVSRSTVNRHISNNESLREILEDIREGFIDDTEDALRKAVQDGEAWAVCFALKTVGKSRGYVERTEHKIMDVSKLSDDELRAIVES